MLRLFKKTSLQTINKAEIDREIEAFNDIGITGDDKDLIVSLTSYPQRMYDIHYTLYSLLNQSVKPGKVILWLSKEEFPNLEADVPQKVLQLKNNGLTINWCTNTFSYKKLIPTLTNFPNNTIVTADDDIYYEKDWLKILVESHKKNSNCIISHRAHKIKFMKDGTIAPYKKWTKKIRNIKPSFLHFLTGAGGVLYPANCFYKDVLNEKNECSGTRFVVRYL